jgi:4-methyl-5(b-hydroxyethyl)-thiazole monophosphate biosynthesis
VVVDGNCVTSQGPGTVLEFALMLIELLYDKSTADAIAQGMLVSR